MLNLYFTELMEVVHAHNGVLDKFIGDAALCLFGLTPTDNPCQAAYEAAQGIRDCLEQVNERLEEDFLPTLDNGVGLDFGVVVAGNIGSEQRLEYTVIGSPVNIACRLEGLAKKLDQPLITSHNFYSQLPEDLKQQMQSQGHHQLNGMDELLEAYSLKI